jgi:hypothetical protein
LGWCRAARGKEQDAQLESNGGKGTRARDSDARKAGGARGQWQENSGTGWGPEAGYSGGHLRLLAEGPTSIQVCDSVCVRVCARKTDLLCRINVGAPVEQQPCDLEVAETRCEDEARDTNLCWCPVLCGQAGCGGGR